MTTGQNGKGFEEDLFFVQNMKRELLKTPRESPRRKLTARASSLSDGGPAKLTEHIKDVTRVAICTQIPCTKALATAQDKIEPHRCNQDWQA